MWLLGSEFSWKCYEIVVVGEMGLWRRREKKIEAGRIDDEEDSAFVGRR